MSFRLLIFLSTLFWVAPAFAQDKDESKKSNQEKPGVDTPKKRTLPTPEQLASRLRHSVAIIEGQYGHGTGFVVLPNVIATNAHVIRDELMRDVKASIIRPNGSAADLGKVELLWEDKEVDLALLRVITPEDARPLKLNSGFEPNGKRKVYIMGNPGQQVGLARINALGEGVAEEIVRLNKKLYVQVKVTSNTDKIDVGPGNSGGPVVDGLGLVVGVLTAGIMEKGKPSPKTFYIPANVLKPFVDQLGSPDEWDEKAQKAMARHALDIVTVQLLLNTKIARNIFQARMALTKDSREDKQRFANLQRNPSLQELNALDKKLIDIYKEFDTQCQKLIQGPFKTITTNKNLPDDLVADHKGMQANLDQIRKLVMKSPLSNADQLQCNKNVTNCDGFFQRLKSKTGLTDDVVDGMLKLAIAAIDEKIGKQKLK